MIKKTVSLFIIMLMLTLCIIPVNAAAFKDVSSNADYYNAVEYLSQKGIISGYGDGTFKPDNSITRAEAATIIVRAANLQVRESSRSIYSDVSDSYWGRKYIMAATEAGIISGMGNGTYEPESNVTHNQIIKMIVCMLSLGDEAEKNGKWPYNYLLTATENSIINHTAYSRLSSGYGNEAAVRGDVAKYVYNALMRRNEQTVEVSGKKYYIGMSASELGIPDEKVPSTSGFTWYVYGTKTYKDFVAVGVYNNKVVEIASAGPGFIYNGYRAGDTGSGEAMYLVTDSNDGNIIHGVCIYGNSFNFGAEISATTLQGESKMILHYTNAFRAFHNTGLLKWSSKAAEAARLHSEDMANNDYFSHTSLDGRSCGERLAAQGIKGGWAENICAGYRGAFRAYDGWVNSEGHRRNMLNGNRSYLGVGAAYNQNSKYSIYFTQNFHT